MYANKFGVEGARALITGLKKNESLEILDLGCNAIRNKGAAAISEGILAGDSKSGIRALSLKNNFINAKGFKFFVSHIMDKVGPLVNKEALHLSVLLLGGNEISIYELGHLERVLKD